MDIPSLPHLLDLTRLRYYWFIKLNNKGTRLIEFKDGTKLTNNFCTEMYSNSFFGTLKHESLGETVFKDLTNGYECVLKYASVKKK
jgi:hypothetical protein